MVAFFQQPPPDVDDITARRRIVRSLCPGHAVALRPSVIRHDGSVTYECSWSRCSFRVEVRPGTLLFQRMRSWSAAGLGYQERLMVGSMLMHGHDDGPDLA